jgi:membrane-bound metal-dependent hydrolase YbcI (DUF457 family)
MASYRGHLTFSTALGAGYGALTLFQFQEDPATAVLAGGVTAVGGLLPDLDSDSGVPVRELFNWSAAVVPMMFLGRLVRAGCTTEQTLVVLGAAYLFIRFGLSELFRRLSVHRGMWHSVPAMLCAGLLVFLLYHDPGLKVRTIMGVGVALGFLSHLVLDEIYSVDFRGLTPKLNKFAGSAVKFSSSSAIANLFCYGLLALLSWLAVQQVRTGSWRDPLQAEVRRAGAVLFGFTIGSKAASTAPTPATPPAPEPSPEPRPATPVISVPSWSQPAAEPRPAVAPARPADPGWKPVDPSRLPAGVLPTGGP